MAMSGSALGDVIAAARRAAFETISNTAPATDEEIDAIAQAEGVAIVSYIQANATVTITSGSSAGTWPVQ